MKKSRFTEQQIAFALQQAEGETQVAEVWFLCLQRHSDHCTNPLARELIATRT